MPRRNSQNRNEPYKEAKRKQIKFIQLFDYKTISQLPDFPQQFSTNGKLEYRILPQKYSTNSAIHIFGDYVITYTGLSIGQISDDVIFFVLHSHDLAESYRTWFWYMWEQSTEQKKSP